MTAASASGTAHPRACGENSPGRDTQRAGLGSSPRMRGKRGFFVPCNRPQRLIPAHAGKTGDRLRDLEIKAAHPRACGENPKPSRLPCLPHGSSPRMRGKPRNRIRRLVRTGLIPAHAGKTVCNSSIAEIRWAHPRACGENARASRTLALPPGSSPRMRGKRHFRRLPRAGRRLIPAHAGKTRRCPAVS